MSVVILFARFKHVDGGLERDPPALEEWLDYVRRRETLRELKPGDVAIDPYSGESWRLESPNPGDVEWRMPGNENLRHYLYWSRGTVKIPAPCSEPFSGQELIWEELEAMVEFFGALLYDEEGKVLMSSDERYPKGSYLP